MKRQFRRRFERRPSGCARKLKISELGQFWHEADSGSQGEGESPMVEQHGTTVVYRHSVAQRLIWSFFASIGIWAVIYGGMWRAQGFVTPIAAVFLTVSCVLVLVEIHFTRLVLDATNVRYSQWLIGTSKRLRDLLSVEVGRTSTELKFSDGSVISVSHAMHHSLEELVANLESRSPANVVDRT